MTRRRDHSLYDLLPGEGQFDRSAAEDLYAVALQRSPDTDTSGTAPAPTNAYALQHVFESQEFKSKARNPWYFSGRPNDRLRVLLFGAYGNGNLGDAIQAQSLRNLIVDRRPDADVWACSDLEAQFPFNYANVLPKKFLANGHVLRHFDLLLIGGGGLLSHPHAPLFNEGWQASLQIPVAIFGVGAINSVAERSRPLLDKAIYVSGRDVSSLGALNGFRDDVSFVPDPVLCDRSYASALPRSVAPDGGRSRKLWILKHAPKERIAALTAQIGADDEVCFVEPALDFPLIMQVPQAKAIYSVEDLFELMDGVDLVVSMRYHGCILAMARGKPVVGLHEQKSKELLERYGNGAFFFNSTNVEIPDLAGYTPPRAQIANEAAALKGELDKVLAAVS